MRSHLLDGSRQLLHLRVRLLDRALLLHRRVVAELLVGRELHLCTFVASTACLLQEYSASKPVQVPCNRLCVRSADGVIRRLRTPTSSERDLLLVLLLLALLRHALEELDNLGG